MDLLLFLFALIARKRLELFLLFGFLLSLTSRHGLVWGIGLGEGCQE